MEENKQKLMLAGDDWMRQNNIVTEATHNNIILNIRLQYPFVKDVEYYMDPNKKELILFIYLSFWGLVFRRTRKMSREILGGISSYLYDYKINVKIKRFKG